MIINYWFRFRFKQIFCFLTNEILITINEFLKHLLRIPIPLILPEISSAGNERQELKLEYNS